MQDQVSYSKEPQFTLKQLKFTPDVQSESPMSTPMQLFSCFPTRQNSFLDIDEVPPGIIYPQAFSTYAISTLRYLYQKEESQQKIQFVLSDKEIRDQLKLLLRSTIQLQMRDFAANMSITMLLRTLNQPLSNMQLALKIAAIIHIADKYEPTFTNFTPLIDKITTLFGVQAQRIKPQLILEQHDKILDELNYEVEYITLYEFLTTIIHAGQLQEVYASLSKYLCFLALTDPYSYTYRPSALAAACVSISLEIQQQLPWNSNLSFWTGYTIQDIYPAIEYLKQLWQDSYYLGQNGKPSHLFQVYSHPTKFRVAGIAPK
ncbi:Cyclin [Spironucleus salmonicida]|uniref:Cyclin n=1 Tax=Spironucleus salmonicida TaxID=348837 RepID=V6LXC6_9EUKA|nr:Cyclin [Spironucleus salmonicida]|eukprot:EST49282.1 Cyclin [Spironucleus salmonicida]